MISHNFGTNEVNIYLFYLVEKGWKHKWRQCIHSDGSLGPIWKEENDYEMEKLRNRDRYYFTTRLGKDYMKDKEVHHSKNNFCFILSPEEHAERDPFRQVGK